jgi:hypothetical protein
LRQVRIIRLAFVLQIGAGLGLCLTHIDWKAQVQTGASPDESQRAQARENGVQILNTICHEKEDYVRGELPGLAEQLKSSNPEIQVQAAGFFYMLSHCRSDSEHLFSDISYTVLSDFAISDGAIKARANATRAIAESKPYVPPSFVSFFIKQIDTGRRELAGPAIFGLARLADVEPEAVRMIHKILTQTASPDFRPVAIDSIGMVNVKSPVVIHDLGTVISMQDRPLTLKILNTLQRLGKPAIEVNQSQLNGLIGSGDKELSDFAAVLLKQLAQ